MKAKRKPMRERTEIAAHCRNEGERTKVFECLATLDFSGRMDEVRARIRLAQGALVQFDRVLPARTKKAAAFGLRVLEALQSAVRMSGMWLAMREAGSAGLALMEANLLRQVQSVLDVVYEAEWEFGHEARTAVAGLGGCGAWLSDQTWVTSGFEEAVSLAFDVKYVVLGAIDNPFVRYLPPAKDGPGAWRESEDVTRRRELHGNVAVVSRKSAKQPDAVPWVSVARPDGKSTRVLRPQVGREKPRRPEETDARDLAILQAMQAGHPGKAVAEATEDFGWPSSQSHVNKRRRDFCEWGWVTPGRDSRLTEAGKRWLALALDAVPRRSPTER